MATIEELTGIVKGLVDVVKSQLSSQHEAQEANRQHIDALAKTVSEMASHSASSSNVDTLKLPQVVLPRYTECIPSIQHAEVAPRHTPHFIN